MPDTLQAGSLDATPPVDFPARRSEPSLFRLLLRDRFTMVAVVILSVVLIAAILGEWLAPHDPTEQNLPARFTPPVWESGGSWNHVLGTDNLGRDMLSRLIVGARLSLLIGTAAGLIAGTIGVTLGLVAGYVKGPVATLIMRLVDLQMALPGLLLLLVIINALGPSVELLILILGFSAWMLFARVVRGETLALGESAFVEGARAVGATPARVISRHILPNVMPTVVTLMVLEIGPLILAEAGLSFLGLGIQPPSVAWGLMIAQGREFVSVAWWVMFFPGLAITVTVVALSITAVWLRATIDPLHRSGA